MKKVIIKCTLNNSLVSKCHVIIFDKSNNKMYDKYINNWKIELCLVKDVYRIIIIANDIMLSTSFIVNDNTNRYHFCLNKNDNSLKITAILVDKNYTNLPIERGKIKLWQDHIQ